jgi:hypothetical protein
MNLCTWSTYTIPHEESQDSSVDIKTGYGFSGRGIRVVFLRGKSFSLLHSVQTDSEPLQDPVQWVRLNRRYVVTWRKTDRSPGTCALPWERGAHTEAQQPLCIRSFPQFGHWPQKHFSVVSTFLQNHLGSWERGRREGVCHWGHCYCVM